MLGRMIIASQNRPGNQQQPSVVYGQSAEHHAGTDGNIFVDALNGDDSNAGTRPDDAKATLGAAITAANAALGDQVIRLIGNGVKYRERIDFIWTSSGLSSLKIAGYGTDRPIITGAEVLTGWVPCTSADSALIGPDFPSIYKTTVSNADYPAPNYWATLMSENDEPLVICGLRNPARKFPDFFFDNVEQGFREEVESDLAFELRSGTWYDKISHPSRLAAFSDAQLQQTVAALHSFPNVTTWQRTISVAGGIISLEAVNARPASVGQGRYALLNLLPTMMRGQWGYRDNGNGTTTFFVWPNDSTNLMSRMELAVRSTGMRVYRTLSNTPVTVEGIDFAMFSRGTGGSYALSLDGLTALSGNSARVGQCCFRHYASEKALEIKFQEQAVEIEHCTFREGVGFGMQTANATGRPLYGYRVRNCIARDISQTGFRMFGVRDCIMSDVRAVRTSGGGHANAINFYSGCDRCVVINFQGGNTLASRLYEGYGTNQASSGIYWLHCIFSPAADGRAYVDQSAPGAVHPTPGSGGALINCWVPDMTDRRSKSVGAGGITVGRDVMPWELYNNVAPAIVQTGGALTRRGNVLTYANVTGDATETLARLEDLFVDAQNDDWRAVPGSLLETSDGQDVSEIIERLEAWFPSENFRRDASGRAWSPATPGLGPFGLGWSPA